MHNIISSIDNASNKFIRSTWNAEGWLLKNPIHSIILKTKTAKILQLKWKDDLTELFFPSKL